MKSSLGPIDDGWLRHGCWSFVDVGRRGTCTLRGCVVRGARKESVVGRRRRVKEEGVAI